MDATNESDLSDEEVATDDEEDHNIQEQTSEDEDLVENFQKYYDLSNSTPLHPLSPLSTREGCNLIMKLSHDINLDKSHLQLLLNSFHLLLSAQNNLPKIVKQLFLITDN
ncbi:unnamed protein product, partial [Didymodactylos carnosus]